MKNLIVLFAILFAPSIFAKRSAPDPVAPIEHNGVIYSVEHWGKTKDSNQNGGLIIATDSKTNKVLWQKLIYKIEYDNNLEGDVQDVFITKLTLSEDKKFLIIINEKKETYQLNLETKEVLHIIK